MNRNALDFVTISPINRFNHKTDVMIRNVILFLFLSGPLTLLGQARDCDCLENLNRAIQKTEENYAGFPTKVTAQNKNAYGRFVQSLTAKAAMLRDPKKCYAVISEYVSYFFDKHFVIAYIDEKDIDSSVVSFPADYWKKGVQNKSLLPVEGIWTNPDSSTTIGILKSGNGLFKAVKIDSKTDTFPRGFVYFTLTQQGSQFVVKEYNSFLSTSSPARQSGQLLQLWNHALWGKTYPGKMTAAERKELSTWKNNNNGLAFRKLNSNFTYLKVPTFYNNDNKIQELVASSDSIIRNTRFLIVDLTGNGGGNTGWIYFLSYFMTNPIEQKPSFLRVTPDNVKLKLPDLEPFVKYPISEEYKKYFPENILNAYKKAYEELPLTRDTFYPIPGVTFPLDSITRYPEKIALVVDNFCGSSSEYFFYISKQSRKTITYGASTIGMMDYEGMSVPTPMPYNKFILTIPIAKSSWTDTHPIDKTGFKPDVIINRPLNEWTEFIIRDLEKRKKLGEDK